MKGNQPPPTRFIVAANPQMQEAEALSPEICGYLQGKGVEASAGMLMDDQLVDQIREGGVDIMIVLGGDGTMLRAGHLCGPLKVPILGINLGRFGFLTEVQVNQWESVLSRVMKGDYWLEQRMMLLAEHYRQGERLDSWDVLNECVVGRGDIVRPVRLTTEIDGRFLTTYVADALIAASATGSTAYALAAGGPILPPELRNILIVPVAPHLSVDRAIVLHEGSSVKVTVQTDHQAIISIDGQPPVVMQDGDEVKVCAGEHTVAFVRLQDPGYFYRNLTSRMNQNPSAGGSS